MRGRAAGRTVALMIAVLGVSLAGGCICLLACSPVTPIPTTPTCQAPNASLTVAASATTLQVGQAVTITATLANRGCGLLGLPQYRLYIEPGGEEAILDPAMPAPVAHQTGIGSGETDTATFVLRATRPGQATLTASASFEVHAGSAYWGNAGAGPLVLTVNP